MRHDLRVRHIEAASPDRMWGGVSRCGALSVRQAGYGCLVEQGFSQTEGRRVFQPNGVERGRSPKS